MPLRKICRLVLGALLTLVLCLGLSALLNTHMPAQAAFPATTLAALPATATPIPACGPAWRPVASPNVGPGTNDLRAVAAVSTQDLWAVGDYARPDGVTASLIEHWDGAAWTIIPSPSPGRVNILYAVAVVNAQDIWAVGSYIMTASPWQALLEHWDGQTWSLVPGPQTTVPNGVRGLTALAPTDVWAVGDQTMHWDGSTWTFIPDAGVGGLYSVAAVSPSDIWAVGQYYNGSQTVSEAVHWNGAAWSLVPSPNGPGFDNIFHGVAALASNDVWAVGAYIDGQQGGYVPLIEHWDGSMWSILPSQSLGSSELNAIAARSASDIWVVGDSENVPGIYPPIVEHWDGLAWSLVPAGEPVDVTQPNGVAAPAAGEAWMVGEFDARPDLQTYVMHYSDPCLPSPTPQPPTITSTTTPTSPSANTPTPLPTVCSLQFADVQANDPFYPYIRCLACRQILSGYSSSPPCVSGSAPCFQGGTNVTRGQIAKIVANAAGLADAIPSGQQTFADVPASSPFWVYIERAVLHGVLSGYTTSPPCTAGVPCFLPANNVTRGQLAKIAVLAAGLADPVPSSQQTFSDVPPSSPFWVYVERAVLHGVLSGYATTPPCPGPVPCFLPASNVTRNQTAKIVANTFYPGCQTPARAP